MVLGTGVEKKTDKLCEKGRDEKMAVVADSVETITSALTAASCKRINCTGSGAGRKRSWITVITWDNNNYSIHARSLTGVETHVTLNGLLYSTCLKLVGCLRICRLQSPWVKCVYFGFMSSVLSHPKHTGPGRMSSGHACQTLSLYGIICYPIPVSRWTPSPPTPHDQKFSPGAVTTSNA